MINKDKRAFTLKLPKTLWEDIEFYKEEGLNTSAYIISLIHDDINKKKQLQLDFDKFYNEKK
jgi:hypothetical protein